MLTLRGTAISLVAVILILTGTTCASRTRDPQSAQIPPAEGFQPVWREAVEVSGLPRMAVGRSAVFITSVETGVVARALDDGRELWKSTCASGAPPITIESVVAVASGTTLCALDQDNGRVMWQREIPTAGDSIRLSVAGSLIVTATATEVRAWKPDGSPAWLSVVGGATLTRVAADASAAYVGIDVPSSSPGVGESPAATAPELLALDLGTGNVRWRIPLPTRPTSLGLGSGRLFFAGADGRFYCYKTNGDRDPEWRYRAVGGVGDPVADETFVYAAFMDNTVRAFDPKSGSQRWSSVLDSRPAGSPMLAEGRVLVAGSTGSLGELTRSGVPASPADPGKERERTHAVAATADGATAVTVGVLGNLSCRVTAWRRQAKKN